MKQKIILIASIVIFILALLAVSQLEIMSNMEDMLPKDSEALIAAEEFNQYFESQDQVIIVVKQKGETEDYEEIAHDFMNELTQKLQGEEYIDSLLYRVDKSEMAQYLWAYLDMVIYEEVDLAIADNDIAKIRGILKDIEKDRGEHQSSSYEYMSNNENTHFIMMIKPRLDQKDFMGSRTALYDGVTGSINELLLKSKYKAIDSGITGGAFIQDIEADTVAFDGLLGTMIITLIMILLVVILFFKSLKLPLLSLYPLILGAVIAAASAYFIYGALNMFAVSFALLLLGLGIDFAVHLLTRYQEERNGGENLVEAINISVQSTGSSIVFGAITTAVAFGAFAFAKFKAFEQMGVISAIGLMAICVGMLILIPLLIMVFDKKNANKMRRQIDFNWLEKMTSFNIKRPWVVGVAMLTLIVSLFSLVWGTTIQSDITAIYPRNIPSLEWANEVEQAFNYNLDTISIFAENEEKLASVVTELVKRDDIEKIDSIYDYMPERVDEKLAIAIRLDKVLNQLGVNALEQFTLEAMSIEDLPQSIRDNYIGKEGRIRAEIVPAINIYDKEKYDTLVNAIRTELGRNPVGMPTLFNEVTVLVKEDIIRISIFCFAIVFIISWIIFKKIKYALLLVAPLAMTLYTTLGLLPIFNIEINIFSIAAFPLIIGIGIDSGIHLIHRLNEVSQISTSQKVMRTGRAIMLTSITTIIGFGSLGLINHPGMSNLGLAVVVGIFMSMVYTLVIIPLGFEMLNGKRNY